MSSPPRQDEEALVDRAKRDPDAFGELYHRYLLQIYRFVYSRARDLKFQEDMRIEDMRWRWAGRAGR